MKILQKQTKKKGNLTSSSDEDTVMKQESDSEYLRWKS